MKLGLHVLGLAAVIACSSGAATAASMILNEYNGVRSDVFLKKSGSDSYFGKVAGNGGDWMEFVVTQNNLDIRGWSFATTQAGAPDTTIVLPSLDAFACLKSGTIFTISEDLATDLSYNPVYNPSNPNAGDWWINYQAAFSGETATVATHDNFQVTIYNAAGGLVFGPAGEGIYPASGVGKDVVFKLEADPSAAITPDCTSYNSGTSSTFGSPNLYSGGSVVQDFSALRAASAVPEPTSILALVCGIAPLAWSKRRSIKK